MGVADTWTQLGSSMAGVMFALAMLQKFFPYNITGYITGYLEKYFSFFYPYIEITFHEYNSSRFKRSDAYSAIESYLGATSSSRAKRFKGDLIKNCKSLVLTMDDHEEITDEFQGVKVWWKSSKTEANSQAISLYPSSNDEKRYYVLTFNVRNREMITNAYLNFVIQQGKDIAVKNRQRKLFTNGKNDYFGDLWSHIVFKHPASFQSLAMESKKKSDIVNDLITFSKSRDYYATIGKAWKRGYLLYGPPGTGKSTMIAAMANLLEYDIYDLELTSVKDNTELRKLLIEITSKSIIVIEDIDCSLDLTGQRKSKAQSDDDGDSDEDDGEKDTSKIKKAVGDEGENKKKGSEVTLSGLLNFIDGLWSASGGERIIVFTTNHVEKLDPALIRRGRMDKHIELSYCCYESFKILAKNYLKIEYHPMFDEIQKLLEENKVTPADVAENLMPKNIGDDPETTLKSLIQAIETKKEEKTNKKTVKDEEKGKSLWKSFKKGFWKKKSPVKDV